MYCIDKWLGVHLHSRKNGMFVDPPYITNQVLNGSDHITRGSMCILNERVWKDWRVSAYTSKSECKRKWKMAVVPGWVLHKGGAHTLFNHLWDPALQHRHYTVKHESETFSHAGPVSFLSESVTEENKLCDYTWMAKEFPRKCCKMCEMRI